MNAPEKLPAATRDLFVSVPETILPGGRVVPAFKVGQFLTSQNAKGKAAITAEGAPWVRINYHEARKAADEAGYKLITDSQALALAYQVAAQDSNWTGGKVGTGKLFQGFRKGTSVCAAVGDFEPADPDERRWFILPNGERIYDVAGNAYTWVEDDTQGDAKGLIAKPFTANSPSIVIPYPAEDKGQGWTPRVGADWSGLALIRGGCWFSGSDAGAFYLSSDWPVCRYDLVGFRCTN